MARRDALTMAARSSRICSMRFRLNGPRRTSPIELWTPRFELLDWKSPVRQTWRSGLGSRTLGTDPSPRRQGR